MSEIEPGRSAVLRRVLGWTPLLAAVVLGNLLVEGGIRDDIAVPLRSHPGVLRGALLLVLLSTLALSFAGGGSRLARALRFAGMLALACGFASGVAALSPGTASVVARDLLLERSPSTVAPALALPFFFDNARAVLTRAEAQRLSDATHVFASCATGKLAVRGFASSAEFAEHNEFRNRELANDRAEAVTAALRASGFDAVAVLRWKSLDQMRQARRIRDTDELGKRLQEQERMNRRAEVVWDQTSCLFEVTALGEELAIGPAT